MSGFVLGVPLAKSAAICGKRYDRLMRAGWQRIEWDSASVGAMTSSAAHWRSEAAHIIGMAHLTNREAILNFLNGPKQMSDIALIGELYARLGNAFQERVCGAFAIAIIDATTGQCKLFRDHLGQIPLYYCTRDDALTCGTDLRAVLHLSGVSLGPQETRIADFIVGREVDPTLTAFDGVYRLPAAHCLTTGAGVEHHVVRYWDMSLPPEWFEAKAPEALRIRLEAATGPTALANHPVGVMLSGGLDSSALVGFAAMARVRAGRAPLPVLSFVHPDKPYDESNYIDAVNAMHETEPVTLPVSAAPNLSEIDGLIEEQMELFLGYALQKSRHIYAEAQARGLTHLIDGHGGDEVVSHGAERLVELAASRKVWTLWKEMRGPVRLFGDSALAPFLLYLARYAGFADRSWLRRVLLRSGQSLSRRARTEQMRFSAIELLPDALRDRIKARSRYAARRPPKTRDALLTYARSEHRDALLDAQGEHALEVLFRSAQAADVMPVYPFFDRRLVEFCLSLPADMKLRDGQTRWILRRAIGGVVPKTVENRTTKADFSPEFVETVRQHCLTHAPPDLGGLSHLVDAQASAELFDDIAGTSDTDAATWRARWRLIVLGKWWTSLQGWAEAQQKRELI
ncbi:MAG: asparagine synthase-related protein [Pseudomonadota bacterium]